MFRVYLNISMILFVAVATLMFAPGKAYAYLDPGTGSIILQGILGGLAAAAVVARLYWHRLLVFLRIRKDQPQKDKKEQYAESSGAHNYSKGDRSK